MADIDFDKLFSNVSQSRSVMSADEKKALAKEIESKVIFYTDEEIIANIKSGLWPGEVYADGTYELYR